MKKLGVVSSSFLNEENCIICKNNIFLIAFLILLINISFLSAQTYTLKVTDEHPFFVFNIVNFMQEENIIGKSKVIDDNIGKWKKANELKVGDLLVKDNGKRAKIISIKEVIDDVDVYNMHVDGLNDYFAGNVLVHNKGERNKVYADNEDLRVYSDNEGRINVEIRNPNVDIDSITIDKDAVIYKYKESKDWKITVGKDSEPLTDINQIFIDQRTGEGYFIDEIGVARKIEAYERWTEFNSETGLILEYERVIYKDDYGFYHEFNSKTRNSWPLELNPNQYQGFKNNINGKKYVFVDRGNGNVERIEVDLYDEGSNSGLIFDKTTGTVKVLRPNGQIVNFEDLRRSCNMYRFVLIDKWDSRVAYVTDRDWKLSRVLIISNSGNNVDGTPKVYGKPIAYYKTGDDSIWLRLEDPLTKQIKHLRFSKDLMLNGKPMNEVISFFNNDKLIWDRNLNKPVIIDKDGNILDITKNFPDFRCIR